MSVLLYEPGLFEVLESPTGPTTRNVTAKAEAVAALARQNVLDNFKQRSGRLHDSIGIFPEETVEGVQYQVGEDASEMPRGPYGLLLEQGSNPHFIFALRTQPRMLWSLGQDPNHPDPLREKGLTGVAHPGNPPKPWLKPALEAVFSG